MGEAEATGPGLGWREGDVGRRGQLQQRGRAEEWATGNTNLEGRGRGSWKRRSQREGCPGRGQVAKWRLQSDTSRFSETSLENYA